VLLIASQAIYFSLSKLYLVHSGLSIVNEDSSKRLDKREHCEKCY